MLHKVFAYGSNMNLAQMHRRCPSARALSKALLPGYELIFPRTYGGAGRCCADGSPGGVASIKYSGIESEVMEGVIYEITSADLKKLDGYEGLKSNSYYRDEILVELEDGTKETCLVYIANALPGAPFLPSHTYKGLILEGALEHGLSERYRAKLNDIESR